MCCRGTLWSGSIPEHRYPEDRTPGGRTLREWPRVQDQIVGACRRRGKRVRDVTTATVYATKFRKVWRAPLNTSPWVITVKWSRVWAKRLGPGGHRLSCLRNLDIPQTTDWVLPRRFCYLTLVRQLTAGWLRICGKTEHRPQQEKVSGAPTDLPLRCNSSSFTHGARNGTYHPVQF